MISTSSRVRMKKAYGGDSGNVPALNPSFVWYQRIVEAMSATRKTGVVLWNLAGNDRSAMCPPSLRDLSLAAPGGEGRRVRGRRPLALGSRRPTGREVS